MARPVSVTVVGWVIIALSLEGLIGLLGGIVTPVFTSGVVHTPYSLPVTVWITGVTLSVNIVLGALILSGFGWARIVYICILTFGLLGLLIGRQPISLTIVTIAKLAVFSYFLFRHESNEYFAKCASGAA